MNDWLDRRDFLRNAAAFGAGVAALGGGIAAAQEKAKTKSKKKAEVDAGPVKKSPDAVVVGMIGTGGRGTQLTSAYSGLPGAEVRYVCDVDQAAVGSAASLVEKRQGKRPEAVTDLRRVLDDPKVEAVVIATPDHWHTPAALLALKAGKNVYVEKPCCHNPHEGELLVEAAKKYGKVVQHGTQRRSSKNLQEALNRMGKGELGTVRFSRGWYTNNRPETGKRTPAPVPPGLNWELWQGPAPEQPFTENVVPYKWHWYWTWGTGECGNNGVHSLDVCRWGLQVDYPTKATASGGRYYFKDDQQTPDTHFATYEFPGDKVIHWEGRSCLPTKIEGSGFGIAFYGDKGTMVLDGAGYEIRDMKDKVVENKKEKLSDIPHHENFLGLIRGTEKKQNAPIEEGYKSVLLCHLGNIAWRVGRTVKLDDQTHRITGDPDAEKLWRREYRPGWEQTA